MKWGPAFDHLAEGAGAAYLVDRERRIRAWNSAAEQASGYAAGQVLGRRCQDGLLTHVDGCGRALCDRSCPMMAAMTDGQVHRERVWMKHADGSRRPVTVRTAPVRDPETHEVAGAIQTFVADPPIRPAALPADQIDPMTGLGDGRYLRAQLATWLDTWSRSAQAYGLLRVAVDEIDQIAAGYGPAAGDRLVIAVARTLTHTLPASAVVAHDRRSEFAILDRPTDPDSLTRIGEQTRALINACEVVPAQGDPHGRLDAIVAGAVIIPGDDPGAILRRVEVSLWSARRADDRQVIIDPGDRRILVDPDGRAIAGHGHSSQRP